MRSFYGNRFLVNAAATKIGSGKNEQKAQLYLKTHADSLHISGSFSASGSGIFRSWLCLGQPCLSLRPVLTGTCPHRRIDYLSVARIKLRHNHAVPISLPVVLQRSVRRLGGMYREPTRRRAEAQQLPLASSRPLPDIQKSGAGCLRVVVYEGSD